jgi:hypothetical protein
VYWDSQEEATSTTVPLIADHGWDLPPDPHEGHAAALNVPCSVGDRDYVFERGMDSDRALIEAVSPIEPGRQMEAGTRYSNDARTALLPLMSCEPFEVK